MTMLSRSTIFIPQVLRSTCVVHSEFVLAVLLALLPCFGSASDGKSGMYIVGGGVGSIECPKFVATMERAKAAGLGSLGYANEIYGYGMYLAGFQTAYNMQTPQTCDVFGEFTSDQRLAWLENFCRGQPLEKFGSAVVALSKEVHPRRVQSCK